MAQENKIVTSFFTGALVGLVGGYFLATDKEKRTSDLNKLKKAFENLKEQISKKKQEVEEDIYNS